MAKIFENEHITSYGSEISIRNVYIELKLKNRCCNEHKCFPGQ